MNDFEVKKGEKMSSIEHSISFKKSATKTSIKHNNRDFEEADWNTKFHRHIDRERSDQNQYLIQKDIHEMYDELFGEAVEEYNTKQKRDDRKIDDYFSHVNQSKTLELQREFIIQVGDISDFEEDEKNDDLDIFFMDKSNKEKANSILKYYVDTFEIRNPNLKIYNAVIHNDEASPHLHLNVIPVAEGYKRGVNKQPSFNKALKQQGITPGEDNNIFKAFRDREVQALEKSMLMEGWIRKKVGTNHIRDVREYKEVMSDVSRMRFEVHEKESEYNTLVDEYNALEMEIEGKKTQVNDIDKEIQIKQNYINEFDTKWFNKTRLENMSDSEHLECAKEYMPNRFGTDRLEKAKKINYLQSFVSTEKLFHRDYAKLNECVEKRARRMIREKTTELTDENQKLKKENHNLSEENERLKREIKRQNIQKQMDKDTIDQLQKEVRGLKKTIKVLEDTAKEFIDKTANRFKHVYFSILGHLSFDKGVNVKHFSPTYESNIEAFNKGYQKAKKENEERFIYRGNDLEL